MVYLTKWKDRPSVMFGKKLGLIIALTQISCSQLYFKAIKFGFESLNVPFTVLFANRWGVKFICVLTLNLFRIWCIFNTIQYTLLSSNHIFSLILWSRRYFIDIHSRLEHSFAVKRNKIYEEKISVILTPF